MNRVQDLPTQDKRFDEASSWIAKMDKGLSTADEKLLKQWMLECDANRETFLTMAKQWDSMDSLSRLSSIFPIASTQSAKKFWRAPQMIAASIGAAAVAIVLASFGLGSSPQSADTLVSESLVPDDGIYETAVGEQSSIMLSDGTHVKLNTNSLLTVTYSDVQRSLHLERGEISVEVAHDPIRPLRVIARDRYIQAVGTEFNVEFTADELIELVVSDGTVLVGTLASNLDLKEISAPQTQVSIAMPVSAGEKIVLGSPDEHLVTIGPAEIELALSWRQGNLVFRGESLEQVMAEVTRYTDVDFVFLDEESRQVRVVGLFKVGDLNALLSGLTENFNVASERVADDKILISAR